MKITVQLCLTLTILGASLPATAATVRWNLLNVNFSDGGTATGYFVVDTNINNHILPDYQVIVSSGSQLTAFTYSFATSPVQSAVLSNQVSLNGFVNGGGLVLTTSFTNLQTSTGTGVLAIGLGANYENRNPGYREVISGSLTTADVATPEPGTLGLLLLGGSALFARSVAANKSRRQ